MNCLTATRRRKPEDNGFLDRSFSLERPRCAARTGLTMPADARASGLGIGQCCCAVIAQLNHGLSLQVRITASERRSFCLQTDSKARWPSLPSLLQVVASRRGQRICSN